MYLYVCVKYFVSIIWWLTIFNKCLFDVANVGRSLAFYRERWFLWIVCYGLDSMILLTDRSLGCALFSKFLGHNPLLVELDELN